MSVSTITIIVFCAILLGVALLYFAQARERAKVERIQKISGLNERYRRLQALQVDLPPQYLSNELRLLLAERCVETLKELAPLKNDAKIAQQLHQEEELLEQLRQGKLKFEPKTVKTEQEAQSVRKQLQTLFKFVQAQAQRKKIAPAAAKTHLDQISLFACQSKADILVARAENANKAGKPRVAIHNYHSAIAAYKPAMKNPAAVKAVQGFKQRIAALDAVADEHNRKVKEQAQAKLEGSSEWDNSLKDDDSWKKKNQYDD